MTFIDISKWNGVFDWNKALAMGVQGAYIKASEGLYTDSRFKANIANCPLKWRGVYHFLYYGTGASGAKQAEYVVNLIEGRQYNLPVALDIEPHNYDIPFEPNPVLGIATDFVKRYKELTGHYPARYHSGWLYPYTQAAFPECPLWIASYSSNYPAYKIDDDWIEITNYALWQYSNKGAGALYGNEAGSPYIDLNRTGRAVKSWAIGDPFEAPEIEPGVFSAQCTANRLIIRNAPYIANETDTGKRLLLGEIREVTEIQGDWYRIAEGWVSSLYMARVSEPVQPDPPDEPTDAEKLTLLWNAHPELHNG